MIFRWPSFLKLFHTRTFRIALRLWLIMLIGNILLLSMVFVGFFARLHYELYAGYEDELDFLSGLYTEAGPHAMDDYLKQFYVDGERPRFNFILLDVNGNKLAGDLDEWKSGVDMQRRWTFQMMQSRAQDSLTRERMMDHTSLSRTLADGSRLQVSRYIGDVRPTFIRALQTMLIGVALSVATSLIVLSIGSAAFLRRLGPINRDIDIIMRGDISHRLVLEKGNNELDKLAGHINEMLDRIEELIAGIKQVSDNIAHDLRTPLTRLRNNLARLERSCAESEKASVRSLIDESDQLIATFNALLRIARIELNDKRRTWSTVNLRELVGEVIELYEPVAAEKGIDMIVNLAAAEIEADRDLIFQAVVNLLDNAIKYTPHEGRISVLLDIADGGDIPADEQMEKSSARLVTLTIKDTGCGVKEENLDKVFRRFYREDSSRSREPGNGLGLSLVAAVAKIHEATIELENADPGLVVRVRFPTVVSDPAK